MTGYGKAAAKDLGHPVVRREGPDLIALPRTVRGRAVEEKGGGFG